MIPYYDTMNNDLEAFFLRLWSQKENFKNMLPVHLHIQANHKSYVKNFMFFMFDFSPRVLNSNTFSFSHLNTGLRFKV